MTARHRVFLPSVTLGLMASLGLVSACVDPASAPAVAPEPLTITATDFGFEPRDIQVPVGRRVRITFANQAAMEHDWVVDGTLTHLSAKPGERQTKEVVFEQPGEYALTCSIPFHTEWGMGGKVVVSADPNAAVRALSAAPPPVAAPLPAGLSRLPLPAVAPPTGRTSPTTVAVELEAKEVQALVADGVATTYWTFGGTVPGPMVRVRQGDTVELSLKNALGGKNTHSIDLHAVTGPGGGGDHTQVSPGGRASLSFQALNPGVYVYHCATAKVAAHVANGMYGLIVVEPPAGLPPVDREFYLMQGDMYLKGDRGTTGLREFSWEKLLLEEPEFVVMNGGVKAIAGDTAFYAKVGETVRVFFGVGGPNLTSSFHAIGEIFDTVYPAGASEPQHHVQTTLVPAGGATMVEMKLQTPGTVSFVDHSLGRVEKGAIAQLRVEGEPQAGVFKPGARTEAGHVHAGGHSH